MPSPTIKPGDPFCTQCGLVLHGFEASPRCPECAAPLPAALDRYKAEYARPVKPGRRRRSPATLWGWPLVDIALGPDPAAGQRSGHARGIIAIGDTAVGGLAIGGAAVGVVAIGGGSVGVVAIGGGSVGLLAAIGGLALGGYAGGGIAAGGIASGGLSVGVVAQGATALGVYARGVSASGVHVISPSQRDPAAVQLFERLAPIVGATPAPAPAGAAGAAAVGGGGVLPSTALPLGVVVPLLLAGLLAAIIGGVVLHGQRRYERRRKVEIDDAILAPPRGAARRG